ncbi:MAG: hypothetical protein IJT30_10040 [Muribaculaceae bacterium]|nr:hypothetical protein [Muribaculaceae bacterium]
MRVLPPSKAIAARVVKRRLGGLHEAEGLNVNAPTAHASKMRVAWG